MKTPEEFVTFGRGNVEALVRSGQIWAAGMQSIGKQLAANTQAGLDEAVGTFRAVAKAGSVREALDLQAGYARSTMEKAMNQSGQVAEATLKLAEQVVAPIASRLSLATQVFGRAA